MDDAIERPEELSREDLARLVIDFFHRTMVHHTLWFREVEHQMGMAEALDVLGAAWEKSYSVQMKRLSQALGFEMEKGVPKALLTMPKEDLILLLGELGRNWIAGDGVWFQAVEARDGIWDAKRCNDSCWARFSPFEAWESGASRPEKGARFSPLRRDQHSDDRGRRPGEPHLPDEQLPRPGGEEKEGACRLSLQVRRPRRVPRFCRGHRSQDQDLLHRLPAGRPSGGVVLRLALHAGKIGGKGTAACFPIFPSDGRRAGRT
jgi:hypothetical protein